MEVLSRMTPDMQRTITAAAHSAAKACSAALKVLLQALTEGACFQAESLWRLPCQWF